MGWYGKMSATLNVGDHICIVVDFLRHEIRTKLLVLELRVRADVKANLTKVNRDQVPFIEKVLMKVGI